MILVRLWEGGRPSRREEREDIQWISVVVLCKDEHTTKQNRFFPFFFRDGNDDVRTFFTLARNHWSRLDGILTATFTLKPVSTSHWTRAEVQENTSLKLNKSRRRRETMANFTFLTEAQANNNFWNIPTSDDTVREREAATRRRKICVNKRFLYIHFLSRFPPYIQHRVR